MRKRKTAAPMDLTITHNFGGLGSPLHETNASARKVMSATVQIVYEVQRPTVVLGPDKRFRAW